MFEPTVEEFRFVRSQFATLQTRGRGAHTKYLPFAFTEQGIAMLSGVLNSPKAIAMNIAIMRAFIALRQFIFQYDGLASPIIEIKNTVSNHNEQLNQNYTAIENLLYEKAVQKTREERERIGFIT